MQITRRGFLSRIIALAAAPAIVRADSLMRVIAVDTSIILPGTLGIALDNLTPNIDYTHSVWIKQPGGQWESIVTRFNSGVQGGTTIQIPVPKEVHVWGNTLESTQHRGGGIEPQLRLQNTLAHYQQTPFDKCGGSKQTFNPSYRSGVVIPPGNQNA